MRESLGKIARFWQQGQGCINDIANIIFSKNIPMVVNVRRGGVQFDCHSFFDLCTNSFFLSPHTKVQHC